MAGIARGYGGAVIWPTIRRRRLRSRVRRSSRWRKGTPPEEIVAAAKQWVAAFAAADGLAYLPQLATWLLTGGFKQNPPAKRKRRSNKSRDQLPRQNGKVDLTALTLKRAGYVEDENGNLYHPDGNAGTAFWWARA